MTRLYLIILSALSILLAIPPIQAQAAPDPPSVLARERRESGSDTVGWLRIPGTAIDEAIVHNPGGGSGYFLRRSAGGQYDFGGVPYADFRCAFGGGGREDLGHNTVIYGNCIDENPGGILFAQLKKYRDGDFFRDHPILFFSTWEEDMQWQVFAVSEPAAGLSYADPALQGEAFNHMLSAVRADSLHTADLEIGGDDRILTLVTPIYENGSMTDRRFVVMAKLLPFDTGKI